MKVIIAEKPDVGRKIADALGGIVKKERSYIELEGDVFVTWCIGHLLGFSMPEQINVDYKRWLLTDLPLQVMSYGRPIPIEPNPKTVSQLNAVLRLLKKADTAINMADIDAAGQQIFDEVIEYAGFRGKTLRGWFSDDNPSTLRKALSPDHLKPNSDFSYLSNSEYCRSVFDYYYGLNMSRLCTLLYRQKNPDSKLVLSNGRVQTAIFGMVISRQRQHEKHIPVDFYPVDAVVNFNGCEVKMKTTISDGFINENPLMFDESKRLLDINLASQIKDGLTGASLPLTGVVTEDKFTHPPLTFSLLALQKMSAKLFDYEPDKVLAITQSLKDKALLSYNRTDSGYLPENIHPEAKHIFETVTAILPHFQNGVEYADFNIKSRSFNNKKVSAHHGIIPVVNDYVANGRIPSLSEEEANIYTLVARNFLAQFFNKQKRVQTSIEIALESLRLTATQTHIVDHGWQALFAGESHDDSDDEAETVQELQLSTLSVGELGMVENMIIRSSQTQPPKLYTMDTLLNDLTRASVYVSDPQLKMVLIERDKDSTENGGIGTAATRSDAIAVNFKRKLLTKKGKSLVGTQLGNEFYDALPAFATQVDLTAFWQLELNKILNGELSKEEFQFKVQSFVDDKVNELKATGLAFSSVPAAKKHECPLCGSELNRIKGKSGFFWGCKGYQAGCKASLQDKRGKPDFDAFSAKKATVETTEFSCPDCGSALIKRPTKAAGKFWYGCSGFPTCKSRFFEKDGKPEFKDN
ncbi:hypothetical protein HC723_14750 [Vibrio sp. S11_S32]|uniref:DNA topoisomerase n=1 Tax=Vibrio sp. S11_S32 TaxID=2720225 RepID=UPI00168011F6|nr:DNA topoisomerase [Vibrio sp. S11_S32]MBD1577668.1 hypothetical protein [Vibrio sp. S11_S32]